MFVRDQIFPATDGVVRSTLAVGLASWAGLTTETQIPDIMTRRVIAVSSVGGPIRNGQLLNGYGVNVWAETRTDAQNLAIDAMSVCGGSLPGVSTVAAVRDLIGPREIQDDTAFVFNGQPMAHYYFSFTSVERAINA